MDLNLSDEGDLSEESDAETDDLVTLKDPISPIKLDRNDSIHSSKMAETHMSFDGKQESQKVVPV